MAINSIVDELAQRYSGVEIEQLENRRERERRPSGGEPAAGSPHRPTAARASSLSGKGLGLIESMKLGHDGGDKRPARAPFALQPCDWVELEGQPMERSTNFERWLQQACLPVLYEGHDPDYARAARLYLARKRMLHQGGG